MATAAANIAAVVTPTASLPSNELGGRGVDAMLGCGLDHGGGGSK